MSKTKNNPHKTGQPAGRRSSVICIPTLLVLILACYSQVVLAQQSTAIQPCTDSPLARKAGAAKTEKKSVAKATGSETLVDASIPDDPALEKLTGPYSARVRALDVVIGRLEGELAKTEIGAGSLGNFVTDGLRSEVKLRLGVPVTVAITNAGGLRKNTIADGDLLARDIFELLPFENALVQVDVTGEQLLELLNMVLVGLDAQSGARIEYRLDEKQKPVFVSAKIVRADGSEQEIEPGATYSILTIDYLLKVTGGSYSILQEGKNIKPLGITIREALLAYVKSETAAGRPIKALLDDRFISSGSAKREGQPQ